MTGSDPQVVRRTIRRRASEIERRELDRALSRLRERGEVTDEQEQVIAELARAIVAGVLAGPESALASAGEFDEETVRTAVELFGES